MLNRPLSLALAAALACGATACKSKVDPVVAQAQAQKAFQDKQRLALIKVYDDLAKKYPESPNAAKAKETLTDHPGRQEVMCEEFVSGEKPDAAKSIKPKE